MKPKPNKSKPRGLSPRRLPPDVLKRIHRLVSDSGYSASQIYVRFNLAALGVRRRTFGLYVAKLQDSLGLARMPRGRNPAKTRVEALAENAVHHLAIKYRPSTVYRILRRAADLARSEARGCMPNGGD